MVSMFLSLLRIPSRGLWSTTTSKSLHPSVNMRECFRDHDTARASPSVGAYLLSVGVRNRDPARISFQPSGQHTGESS